MDIHEDFREVLLWSLSKGIRLMGCKPAYVSEGWRGIVATEKIPHDTVVLRIPQDAMMSATGSATVCSDFQAVLRAAEKELSHKEVLALHILHELSKGMSSPWHTYLKTLPEHYTNLNCFTDEESIRFQNKMIAQKIVELREEIYLEWSTLLDIMKSLGISEKLSSYESYRWACNTILSRSVYLPGDEAGALCPVGDLFNYHPPPGPEPLLPDFALEALFERDESVSLEPCSSMMSGYGLFDVQAREFVFKTERDYDLGEQIFVCYGQYNNTSLLDIYGFMIDKNIQEEVSLHHAIEGTLKDPEWKSSHTYECNFNMLCVYEGGFPSWELLRHIRFQACLMHYKNFSSMSRKQQAKFKRMMEEGQYVNAEVERQAIRYLQCLCISAMDEFVTTLKQDLDVLSSPSAQRMAEKELLTLRWRINRKHILHKSVEFCERYLGLLGEKALVGSS